MVRVLFNLIFKLLSDEEYISPKFGSYHNDYGNGFSLPKRFAIQSPKTTFLISLYLHPSLTTTDEITTTKQAGIPGVKAYPAGVTAHSATGVLDWSTFYPIFTELERQDLILNLHGETPSDEDVITFLFTEEIFLPTFFKLQKDFPKLRIILEREKREKEEKVLLD